MKHFIVNLVKYEEVEVDAHDEEEAEQKAIAEADEFGSSTWEVEDCYNEDEEEEN